MIVFNGHARFGLVTRATGVTTPERAPFGTASRRGYTVMRTMCVLEHLAIGPRSTPELAPALGVDVRTARPLLQRLQHDGYLIQGGGRHRRFEVAPRLADLGSRLGAHGIPQSDRSPSVVDIDPAHAPQVFGANLRRAREDRGMTQRQLAGKVGMSHSSISLLENGKGDPELDTMVRLAEALGLQASDLVRGISTQR